MKHIALNKLTLDVSIEFLAGNKWPKKVKAETKKNAAALFPRIFESLKKRAIALHEDVAYIDQALGIAFFARWGLERIKNAKDEALYSEQL